MCKYLYESSLPNMTIHNRSLIFTVYLSTLPISIFNQMFSNSYISSPQVSLDTNYIFVLNITSLVHMFYNSSLQSKFLVYCIYSFGYKALLYFLANIYYLFSTFLIFIVSIVYIVCILSIWYTYRLYFHSTDQILRL